MDKIVGYIVGIGLDAIKEKIKDPIMEAEARKKIG